LQSKVFFDEIQQGLKDSPELAKKINATLKWRITDSTEKKTVLATILLQLKENPPTFSACAGDGFLDSKAEVTLTVSDENFVGIATGKLNPQQLFFQKKLGITGNIMLSQKIQVLFNSARPKAKL